MNIDAPKLIISAALPAWMAICVILFARRQGRLVILGWVFLLGGLACFVLTHVLNRVLLPLEEIAAGPAGSIRAAAIGAFIAAALSEESSRLLTSIGAYWVLNRFTRVEMIFVCAMIGLGFALFENALYALTLAHAIEVLVQRTIPTMSHGAVAVIMGSFLQRAVAADRRNGVRSFVLALSVPILLHGLYDFGAFLVEIIEIPDEAGVESPLDIATLGTMLAIMFLGLSVLLVEFVWASRIVVATRKSTIQQDTDESDNRG